MHEKDIAIIHLNQRFYFEVNNKCCFLLFPEPRKHWLTDDTSDQAFPTRNDPLLSSLNDGKNKNNRKKHRPGLLKGIGHMFRFGKHRKDGVADITSDANPNQSQGDRPPMPPRYQNPPPVVGVNVPQADAGNMGRYSHYVNYEEIQNHLRLV